MKTALLTFGLACFAANALGQSVRISANVANVAPRIQSLPGSPGSGSAVTMSAPLSTSSAVPLSALVAPKSPTPLHIGLPLIQTKGLVIGKDVLYVADTGKDATHNEPAKIWKFDLKTKALSKLYEGPLLTNAKWIHYRTVKKDGLLGELFVSDYGVEPNPRTPGTGEGAKVFVIPIDTAGNAKEPRVLHAGAPFRSPEGITVIGETVVVADWASGPVTTLGGRPGQFNRGQLYAIPTAGGTPTVLFPSQVFVTLIGVDHYGGNDGNQYLRLIDIDGGRAHTEAAFLPQSGLPAHFRARILSTEPLVLGKLERVELQEEVSIPLAVQGLKPNDRVEFELHDSARTMADARTLRMTAAQLSGLSPKLTLLSSDAEAFVRATVRVRSNQHVRYQELLDIPKTLLVGRAMDPKASVVPDDTMGDSPHMCLTLDGTSSGVYMSLPDGGLPTTLWRGAPLSQPMGARYAAGGTQAYLSDQSAGPNGTAAIFAIELPKMVALKALYPGLKLQKQIPGLK